jgi:hypothetical protein
MKAWVFQGNPATFDIDGYLNASTGIITWLVARYPDQMEVGDAVYIWRSQAGDAGSAGVVAEGTIAESPVVQSDDSLATPFWLTPPKTDLSMRVKIRINRIANKREMLKRDWMKDDSVLQSMLILRQPAGTNFPLTDAEASRLHQLWLKTGQDWSRDEIIAAIWLYEELLGQPISKSAGSKVEQIAQQIGRAPTGLYNKLMNLRALDPRAPQQGLKGGSKLDEATWDEFFSKSANTMDRAKLNQEYERLWGEAERVDPPSQFNLESEEKRLAGKSIEDLMALYRKRPKNVKPLRRSQSVAAYDRDPMVVALRKKLAVSRCEVDGCTSLIFENDAGDLFVEVHHIIPLSQGGEDILENTVALCPTHHRYLHIGKGRGELTKRLQARRKAEGVQVAQA